MKYTKTMYAMMLAMLPIVLPVLASAQMASNVTLKAQVPFEFVAANKVVPAGQCVVQRTTNAGTVLIIRNVEARVSLVAPAAADETKKTAANYALVFNKEGGQYFLRGIELRGSRITYRLPESKAEIEMHAQNHPATEEIVLAALK